MSHVPDELKHHLKNGSRPVLLCDRIANIAVLTLNVSRRRNAYSTQLRDTLLASVSELMLDDGCRAIIMIGTGGDIGQMQLRSLLSERYAAHFAHRMVRTLAHGQKPVVAAVEGYAYGVDLSIVARCNYVLADPGPKICSAFIRVSLRRGAVLEAAAQDRRGQHRGTHVAR